MILCMVTKLPIDGVLIVGSIICMVCMTSCVARDMTGPRQGQTIGPRHGRMTGQRQYYDTEGPRQQYEEHTSSRHNRPGMASQQQWLPVDNIRLPRRPNYPQQHEVHDSTGLYNVIGQNTMTSQNTDRRTGSDPNGDISVLRSEQVTSLDTLIKQKEGKIKHSGIDTQLQQTTNKEDYKNASPQPIPLEKYTEQLKTVTTFHDVIRLFYGPLGKDLSNEVIELRLFSSMKYGPTVGVFGEPENIIEGTDVMLQDSSHCQHCIPIKSSLHLKSRLKSQSQKPRHKKRHISNKSNRGKNRKNHKKRNKKRKERRMKRDYKKAMKHIKRMENLTNTGCRPVPTIVHTMTLKRAANKVYVPLCTVIHRCQESASCCHHGYICKPRVSVNVTLYFMVHELNEQNEVQHPPIPEKIVFDNHTHCQCLPDKYFAPCMPCPSPFVRYDDPLLCKCGCVDGKKGFENCKDILRGNAYINGDQHKCMENQECEFPTCLYGNFNLIKGRCPFKDEPQENIKLQEKNEQPKQNHKRQLQDNIQSQLNETNSIDHHGNKEEPLNNNNTVHNGQKQEPQSNNNIIYYGNKQEPTNNNTIHHGNQKEPPNNNTIDHGNQNEPPNNNTIDHGNQNEPPNNNTIDHSNQNEPPNNNTIDHGNKKEPPNNNTIHHGNQKEPPNNNTIHHGNKKEPQNNNTINHGNEREPRDNSTIYHGNEKEHQNNTRNHHGNEQEPQSNNNTIHGYKQNNSTYYGKKDQLDSDKDSHQHDTIQESQSLYNTTHHGNEYTQQIHSEQNLKKIELSANNQSKNIDLNNADVSGVNKSNSVLTNTSVVNEGSVSLNSSIIGNVVNEKSVDGMLLYNTSNRNNTKLENNTVVIDDSKFTGNGSVNSWKDLFNIRLGGNVSVNDDVTNNSSYVHNNYSSHNPEEVINDTDQVKGHNESVKHSNYTVLGNKDRSSHGDKIDTKEGNHGDMKEDIEIKQGVNKGGGHYHGDSHNKGQDFTIEDKSKNKTGDNSGPGSGASDNTDVK